MCDCKCSSKNEKRRFDPPPTEVYAFVVGGSILNAGSRMTCAKSASDSGMDFENHVFRYVLQGPVR